MARYQGAANKVENWMRLLPGPPCIDSLRLGSANWSESDGRGTGGLQVLGLEKGSRLVLQLSSGLSAQRSQSLCWSRKS